MLDPDLLERFKRRTREDEQIAEILVGFLDCTDVRSILDVGAGRGVISRALAAKADVFPELEIVEPEPAFQFPASVRVHRLPWEQLQIGRRYDLVVMSHVIGHFPMHGRGEVVSRVLGALTSTGRAVIVENAPVEPYWSLNLEIGRLQTMQYVIDFDDLECALRRHGAHLSVSEHVIPLCLGRTFEEQIEMLNVLFPSRFSPTAAQLVVDRWSELIPNNDGVLPLTQRFYVVRDGAK